MRKIACVSLFMVFVFSVFVIAAEFKPYPGAQMDEKATKEAKEAAVTAKMSGVEPAIYTTSDAFEKVASFYKNIAKEYMMPRASGTSGKPKKHERYDLWEAYFISDGAKDLPSSKLWIKVQRPYIGKDIREMTAIVVSKSK
jgi:hypothetical protein